MSVIDSIKEFFQPKVEAKQYDPIVFEQKSGRRAILVCDAGLNDDAFENIRGSIEEAWETGKPVILDSHFDVILMEPGQKYALIADDELTEEQFQKLKMAVDEAYSGSDNAGKPFIVEGLRVEPLS